MKFHNVAVGLAGAASALDSARALFENDADVVSIPSSYESAVMGRRILALTKLGTLATVFPQSTTHGTNQNGGVGALERRPEGLEGVPIGLMDYVADCEDEGNPTILAIRIATSFKNVRAGSNITLSMQWTPPYPPSKRISLLSRLSAYLPFLPKGSRCPYNTSPASDEFSSVPDTVPYSAANLPRFSLVGYLEPINPNDDKAVSLAKCYTTKHHDARYWLPGNSIHTSEWMRLVVTQVYWIGGFGDRAYIGWIPIEQWKRVSEKEWKAIKLPGEKKD